MKEREPKVMTLRPDGSRESEVPPFAIVSVRESAEYILTGHPGDQVRGSGALSSCISSV